MGRAFLLGTRLLHLQQPLLLVCEALLESRFASYPLALKLALSSAHSPLTQFEVDCHKGLESSTQANRARIQGELCGLQVPSDGAKLTSANITNLSNQFTATVFAQNDSRRFSTDYIPLKAGENKIRVEFAYSGGMKPFTQDLMITKFEPKAE